MLIVILIAAVIIGVGLFALGRYLDNRTIAVGEGLCIFAIFFSGALFIGTIAGLIHNGCIVQESFVIQDKIDMYQEQNDKIETDVAAQVQAYMQYEQQTFQEVTKDNAMQIVQLYPDLKSNTLVDSQIKLHIDNIKKINDLKEQQIHSKIAKWWLYFEN